MLRNLSQLAKTWVCGKYNRVSFLQYLSLSSLSTATQSGPTRHIIASVLHKVHDTRSLIDVP